jgi:hypothetical protein
MAKYSISLGLRRSAAFALASFALFAAALLLWPWIAARLPAIGGVGGGAGGSTGGGGNGFTTGGSGTSYPPLSFLLSPYALLGSALEPPHAADAVQMTSGRVQQPPSVKAQRRDWLASLSESEPLAWLAVLSAPLERQRVHALERFLAAFRYALHRHIPAHAFLVAPLANGSATEQRRLLRALLDGQFPSFLRGFLPVTRHMRVSTALRHALRRGEPADPAAELRILLLPAATNATHWLRKATLQPLHASMEFHKIGTQELLARQRAHPAIGAAHNASALRDAVERIAADSDVEWIEQVSTFAVQNKYARRIALSGMPTALTTASVGGGESGSAPSSTAVPAWLTVLDGRGQIIAVGDTGVDPSICYFRDPLHALPFNSVSAMHRKLVTYRSAYGKRADHPDGHGTHTAATIAGSVVANATHYHTLAQYGGVAPGARLAVFDFNDGRTFGKIRPPRDIAQRYYAAAAALGAAISSNSWGSKPSVGYIHEDLATDEYAWRDRRFLAIFAAGNYGERGAASVVSPGIAKNALTVGATRNVFSE